MSPADIALIRRWVAQRDADAFAEIVSQHSGMVYATCLRILRNTADAEEVAQECFLRLATSAESVRSSLVGWLHRAATTRSLDRLRADRRRLERDTAYVEVLPQADTTEWQDIQGYVDEAIASLPEKYQYALAAHFFEGQTYDALSANLKIPRSTVAYRVQRGVDLVRRALAKRGVEVASLALAAWLSTQKAAAAPAALLTPLQKLAVAGVHAHRRVPRATAAQGLGVRGWAAALGGVAVLAVAALVLWFVNGGAAKRAIEQPGPRASAVEVSGVSSGGLVPRLSRESLDLGQLLTSCMVQTAPPAGDDAPSGQNVLADDGPAIVSGWIRDELGHPLSGANVTLRISRDLLGLEPVGELAAVSDERGWYAFEAGTGVGVVFVSAPGYVTGVGLAAYIAPGRRCEGTNFYLQSAAVEILGIVEDEQGRPIPSADVSMLLYETDGGSRQSRALNFLTPFARSGADGSFAFPLESQGTATLSIAAKGYATALCGEVLPAPEVQRFCLRRGGSVAGRVAFAGGLPVAGGTVHAVPSVPELVTESDLSDLVLPFCSAVTAEDGTYRIENLAAEIDYSIALVQDNARVVTGDPRDFLIVGNGLDTGNVRAVKKGIRITGAEERVVDLVVQPAATVRGMVRSRSGGVATMKVRATLEVEGGELTQSTISGDDGGYVLSLPVECPTAILVEPFYLNQAGISHLSAAAAKAITVAPGKTAVVDFDVDESVTLPVRVIAPNGDPVPGVRLVLLHHRDEAGLSSSSGVDSLTKADGRFTWLGLTPGEPYSVTAVTLNSSPFAQALVASDVMSGAPGEVLPEVTLIYRPCGGVRGTLMAVEGYALWDKQVDIEAIHPDTGDPVYATSRSNLDGEFASALALPEGYYAKIRIRIRRGGVPHHATVNDVTIVRHEITDLGPITVEKDDESTAGNNALADQTPHP